MRRILHAALRGHTLALLFALLAPATARAVPVVALMDFNRLALFDSASPGTIISSGPVTGLVAGDRLIAIDFRPATGQLYGFSTGDRVYIIDPQTRAVVGSAGNAAINPAINGNFIAFDFDPARDRIRIINDDGGRQNFVVDPDPSVGGGVTVEAPPQFAPGDPNALSTPSIYGLAYDNNFIGGGHARAWGIHRPPGSSVPSLVTVGGGRVHTVAQLSGTTAVSFVTDDIGFDIAPVSGVAYAALKTGSPTITVTGFYSVSLSTGAVTPLGNVGEPGTVVDIAVMPPPLLLYAVTDSHELITFFSATPSRILRRAPLTGLVAGEQIYEIDFSPHNGRLYGLGRGPASAPSNNLYTINPVTGVATRIFGHTDFQIPLLVGDAGMEVSPTTGNIRVVTQSDQNLTLPVDGLGSVITHTPLAYAAGDPNAGRDPDVLSAAYANNVARAAATALYDFDLTCCSGQARLARQGSAPSTFNSPTENTGQLFTLATGVGVGVPVEYVGFDIVHGVSGTAFLTTISINDLFSRLSSFNINEPYGANGDGEIGPVGPPGAFERVRDLAHAPSGFFHIEERVEVLEDCAAVTVRVGRVGDTSNEATVDYETFDGRALARSDYQHTRGTLLFAAGQTEATFKVLINEDAIVETGIDDFVPFNGESFGVRLSNPTAGFQIADPIIGGQGLGSVHILDDGDTEATPNPIDASQPFVCQQYHDFLNREPDAAGLAFWTNNIESCGAGAGCREVKRIDTSAAFFLSIEFQQTGYLVYRTYGAAFGLTRIGNRVPLTLQEFLPDTQRVGRGLIVGQGEWQALLDENKRTYFEEFVEREAFRAAYPRTLTAAQYVDALNANAGNPLTPAERAALAAALETGEETRATVLRRVVESPVFISQQKNPAFVLMQYFGYLRRNPNDPPEPTLDFAGYDFWLAKLNQFGGDHRAAEMVKAFITSGEYRRRFDVP